MGTEPPRVVTVLEDPTFDETVGWISCERCDNELTTPYFIVYNQWAGLWDGVRVCGMICLISELKNQKTPNFEDELE